MSVTVRCPDCLSDFHLQPEVLGKAMRCPVCEEVFEAVAHQPGADVVAAPEPEEPPPPTPEPQAGATRADAPEPRYQSGSVADFVPILGSEAADEEEPPEAVAEVEPREVVWDEEPTGTGANVEALPPAPREVDWSEAADATPAIEPVAIEARPPRRSGRRRAAVAFWVLLLATLGGAGYGISVLLDRLCRGEAELWQLARDQYGQQNYSAAAETSQELLEEYPEAIRREEYEFFRDFSELRARAYSVTIGSDPVPAANTLTEFVRRWADSRFLSSGLPEFQNYPIDLWDTVNKLTEELAAKAEGDLARASVETAAGDGVASAGVLLDRAEELYRLLDTYRPDDFPLEDVRTRVAESRSLLARQVELAGAIRRLEELLADGTEASRQKTPALLGRYPEIAAHPRVVAAFEQYERAQAERVRVDPETLASDAAPRDESPPGLLFVPKLSAAGPPPTSTSALDQRTTFFALARGILYALDEQDGSVRWATRVGPDTEVLPLRIPGTDTFPELVLLAADLGDGPGITARLASDGAPLWHQPLEAPCLATPLRVGGRVFVPTADERGTIHEIEITTGYRLSRIVTGRRLAGGAVLSERDGLAYFPAAARSVFAFDVDSLDASGQRLPPRPAGLFTTGHPEGTLLGGPVLIPAEVTGTASPHLILSQQNGLDATLIRVFPLPASGPTSEWGSTAELGLPGWNSFTPFQDLEKLALVTDRGAFGLFGIKQAGTPDPILFPLPPDPLELPPSRVATRGQVVHAGEDAFWVLTDGKLRLLRLAITGMDGLKLIDTPETAIELGTPLHASQVNVRGDRVMVVTQESAGGSCRATAVDLYSGAVVWGRQLGMIAEAEALSVGNDRALTDQGGGLYLIRDTPGLSDPSQRWLTDERWQVAGPVRSVVGQPTLWRGEDHSLRQAIPVRAGLRLRAVTDGRVSEDRTAALPAATAGQAVPLGTDVLIPLEDGSIWRVPAGGSDPESGPSWRRPGGASGATCHLIPIGEAEFLSSDGERTLTRRRWVAGGAFSSEGDVQLRSRIARPPVLFASEAGPRVVVCDRNGVVRLLAVDRIGRGNEELRAWRMSGPVTSGPFSAGGRIGCVVSGSELVWLDPEADEPLWRFSAGPIVGKPHFDDEHIWIASRSGAVVALEPDSGTVIDAVALPSGLAAATGPVPFGPSGLLLPLTDGTVALLSVGEPTAAPEWIWVPSLLPGWPPIPLPAPLVRE